MSKARDSDQGCIEVLVLVVATAGVILLSADLYKLTIAPWGLVIVMVLALRAAYVMSHILAGRNEARRVQKAIRAQQEYAQAEKAAVKVNADNDGQVEKLLLHGDFEKAEQIARHRLTEAHLSGSLDGEALYRGYLERIKELTARRVG